VRAALASVVAAALLGAAGAAAAPIDLPTLAAAQIRSLDRRTDVPILLPARLPWSGTRPRLYLDSWTTGKRGWGLAVAAAPRCGGANACFVATFEATRGGKLPAPSNLRLRGGQRAYYVPIRCGASCGPASIWFVHGGVLHAWQLKEPPAGGKAAMARLAAAAIAAGPR
jgi:hypothetical protein